METVPFCLLVLLFSPWNNEIDIDFLFNIIPDDFFPYCFMTVKRIQRLWHFHFRK